MFGFFEKETKYDAMSPIALPEQYGTFSLVVGGEPRDLVQCDPELHFQKVDATEQKVNFFPDSRMRCLDTNQIDVGGSGFIQG